MQEENKVMPYERTEYPKSNVLIGAKYKSSIIENKIMALGLSMINNGQFVEENGKLTVILQATYLRKKLNMNTGSFYHTLNVTSKNMMGRVIGYSDPETRSFAYVAVVTDCIYNNGVYKIMFNNSLKTYIQELDKNFTILNLTTMLKFNNVYAFRLYELLKSKAFFPKGVTGKKIFLIDFGITELKLDLGVINAGSEHIKTHLNSVKFPDFEKIGKYASEQQFKRWTDFKSHVLDVAINEINESTDDMIVNYEYLQGGKGAKVYRVVFTVDMETKKQSKEISEVVENSPLPTFISNEDVIEKISDIIDEPLKVKDIKVIAEAAGYDIERVQKAYKIAKVSKVDNLVGFLISAIKKGYDAPVPVAVHKTKTNVFSDFPQREYTQMEFKDMEQALLKKARVD